MELKHLCLPLLAAALIGCSSDKADPDITPAGGHRITLSAGLASSTASRVNTEPTADGTEGVKVTWNTADQLQLFAGTEVAGTFRVGEIYADAHSASFTGTLSAVPADGTAVNACVMTPKATAGTSGVDFDFSTQTGTITDLQQNVILTATTQFSGDHMVLSFSHRMTFIRLALTLPQATSATSATVTLAGTGLANKASFNGISGELTTTTGNITLTAAPIEGGQIVAYVALPATESLSDLTATTTVDGVRSVYRLAGTTGKQVEAGKIYVAQRQGPASLNFTKWTDDRAWQQEFALDVTASGATVSITPAEESDWLTLTAADGKVTVAATENATGAPRQAAVSVTSGGETSTFNITQISESDFAGNWDMTAFKVFASTGSSTIGSGDNPRDNAWSAAATYNITPNDATIREGVDYHNNEEVTITNQTGAAVTAADGFSGKQGSHVNNLRLKGLYENLVTDAWCNVDHAARSATVGIFFNSQAGSLQKITTGQYAGQWMLLMPELANSRGSWFFNFATMGGINRFWYMGTVTVAGHTTTIMWRAPYTTARQTLATSTAYHVAGLQVSRYNSGPNPSSTNLIRQKSGNNAAYAVIYQGDTRLRRTASGYKEVVIVGGE